MKYVFVIGVITLLAIALYMWTEVPWVRKINLTGEYQLSGNFSVVFPVREFQELYYADGGSYIFGMIDNTGKTFFVIYPYDSISTGYKKAYLNEDPDLLKQPLKTIPTGHPLDRRVSDPFIYSLVVKLKKQEVIDRIWLRRTGNQKSYFNW
jgi:hypothetical protein